MTWWRGGVLYQIYPRSYRDSNGDGIGDIPGIVEKLDHLHWLGVDGIWLSPIMPSPNDDWGYDVSGYCDVHPDLGTLADLDRLVAEAAKRDIRVLLDFVPNHTSDRHPWFRDPAKRDWYVWADRPNNWTSTFGGPAWTRDEPSGRYYLHNFLPTQPDLNWWNDEVREAMDDVLRFWFDRGVAGFRIDVAHMIIKDRELRDNPPLDNPQHDRDRRIGQQRVYNIDRPEVHDVLRRFRRVAESYDPARVLIGETYVLDVERMARYYGESDDELQLAMNFEFVHARFETERLASIVAKTEEALPPHAQPIWVGSNHDVSRFPTRWCAGDERLVRCVLTMLLTLRGTALLYQGDEIGQVDTAITEDDLRDPVGKRFWPQYRGRDPERTPMHWTPEPGAGFTTATPWLPLGGHATNNVKAQRDDPSSILTYCRDLIAMRRRNEDLRTGSYAPIPSPPGTWVWRRGKSTVIALNLTDVPVRLEGALVEPSDAVVITE